MFRQVDDSSLKNLMDAVATRLNESQGKVRETVVEVLVQKELDERKNAVLQVISLLEKTKKELNKVKPDVVMVSADGVKTECFSKAKADEKVKLLDKVESLSKALDKAFNENNFDKCKELAKGGGDKQESKPEQKQE